MSTLSDSATLPLSGLRIAFVGKLGGFTRREAQQLVREQGGSAVERQDPQLDLIVVGADELPFADPEELLDADARRLAAALW